MLCLRLVLFLFQILAKLLARIGAHLSLHNPNGVRLMIVPLFQSSVRRQGGLLPNSIKCEVNDKIEVGCLTPKKEEAAYDGETPICS